MEENKTVEEPNNIEEAKKGTMLTVALTLFGYAVGIFVGYNICKDTVRNAFTIGWF